jgi:hypothetical protein
MKGYQVLLRPADILGKLHLARPFSAVHLRKARHAFRVAYVWVCNGVQDLVLRSRVRHAADGQPQSLTRKGRLSWGTNVQTTQEGAPEKYRVVLGGVLSSDVGAVAVKLAVRFSGNPQQMRLLLSTPGHVLKRSLSQAEAKVYQQALTECGAHSFIEDDTSTLEIDLPKINQPTQREDEDEKLIRRIADYEHFSGIFWIILGVVQLITVYLALAGIWNIVNGILTFPMVKKIRSRQASVPKAFEPIWLLILIGIVNLLFGAVIGVALVAFDFVIRDKILSNRQLFVRQPVGPELQSAPPPAPDLENRAEQARAFAEAKLAELKSGRPQNS